MGKTTGERIKKLRERRDWSQLELAKRVGINNSVLSRIEAGKRPVETELLKKFSEIFDVTTDYLSGLTDIPSPSAASSHPALEAHKNAAVIGEVADKFGIDLSDPAKRQQLEDIIRIIAKSYVEDKEKK